MSHFPYPSIEQFRHTVKSVNKTAEFHKIELPNLLFRGTVKIHGSNAAVVKHRNSGVLECQSRNRVITPEDDNLGFARFVSERRTAFEKLFEYVEKYYLLEHSNTTDIVVYGEWCGRGIQKNVAVSELERMFVVFSIKMVLHPSVLVEGEQRTYEAMPHTMKCPIFNNGFFLKENHVFNLEPVWNSNRIFHIEQFGTWGLTIDFKRPEASQKQLVEITAQVEKRCPVAAHFGVEGIGEGVVWQCDSVWLDSELKSFISPDELAFKVKGAEHSDTHVRVLAAVDIEKVKSIEKFAQNTVTDHRLEKKLAELVEKRIAVEPKSIPIFLDLMRRDIFKEEADVLVGSGLTEKETAPKIQQLARSWFLKRCPKPL